MNLSASHPKAVSGREYHTHTRPGDIASHCLVVGDPDRATMIAKTIFDESRFIADHRGYRSYTGLYRGMPVSVVSTGIGSPSLCTVLPEIYSSGARLFVRAGTCGALSYKVRIGDVIIVDRALRYESTSEAYAPKDFPALPTPRVFEALTNAAKECASGHYWIGTEATTDDFREGQGRPNIDGVVTDFARRRHEEVLQRGALCYSMEASALFVWCATHCGGIPCGAINATIANRITEEFEVKGEAIAARIALEACLKLKI